MPSRYVMPREELGEYDTEPSRRRSAPARPSSGMLFPLSEEGARRLLFERFSLPRLPSVWQCALSLPSQYLDLERK